MTRPTQKIGRFRSPEDSHRLAVAALLITLSLACPARAEQFSDGVAAFAAKEYTTAAILWKQEAGKGSADALLQLGLLYDLGLGMPRDQAVAFDYYLKAAQLGLADAEFNVAVMLEAGTGVDRDTQAAAIWYARSALAGNQRAAFNLGLMYRDGSGVPVNSNLASYWLGRVSASIPAAATALNGLKPADVSEFAAPFPSPALVLPKGSGFAADLVWTAGPDPIGSIFSVQVVGVDATFVQYETSGSAISVPVSIDGGLWRVATVDPRGPRYFASPWQHPIAATKDREPKGLVKIVVNSTDPRAAELAANLTTFAQSSGLVFSISSTLVPGQASGVQYRFRQDASLAKDVAAFLPGYLATVPELSEDLQSGPGEIVVNLVVAPVNP